MKDASDAILGAEQAAYLEGIEPARDALLAEMEQFAHDRRQPISDPEVASFLAVTARASGATRIVEVGTNIGYGAIVLARAAGPSARVVTIENDPQTVRRSRAGTSRAPGSTRRSRCARATPSPSSRRSPPARRSTSSTSTA